MRRRLESYRMGLTQMPVVTFSLPRARRDTQRQHLSAILAWSMQESTQVRIETRKVTKNNFCKFRQGLRNYMHENFNTICSNMPFFHVAGIVTIMQSIGYAATLVLPAPHFSGEHALHSIVKEKCDVIYGTPSSEMIRVQSPIPFLIRIYFSFQCTST